jgi:prophage regulatory protein
MSPTTTPAAQRQPKPSVVQIKPAILALEDAAAYLALRTRTFQTLVAQKIIAQPRKLSEKRVGWLVSDLDAFATSLPVADALPPPNTGHRKKAA